MQHRLVLIVAVYGQMRGLIRQIAKEPLGEDRKSILDPLSDYIQKKISQGAPVRLNFVCTHNSRRSHMAQVWAQTLASFFGLSNIQCYSGGTEATALFPKVVETLKSQGFRVEPISAGNNPVYSIKYDEREHPVIGFSKPFDHPFNPGSGFAAIMTCSEASENCPYVPGAEERFPVTYTDPKVSDDTPQQTEQYAARSLQIAAEMHYVFSRIQK